MQCPLFDLTVTRFLWVPVRSDFFAVILVAIQKFSGNCWFHMTASDSSPSNPNNIRGASPATSASVGLGQNRKYEQHRPHALDFLQS